MPGDCGNAPYKQVGGSSNLSAATGPLYPQS